MTVGQALITAVFAIASLYSAHRKWDGRAFLFALAALVVGLHGA